MPLWTHLACLLTYTNVGANPTDSDGSLCTSGRYASRLAGEPPGPDGSGYNDIHFHPVEPFQVRAPRNGTL